MTAEEFERLVRNTVSDWAFITHVITVDRTDYAVKMRLIVDPECFVQVYANLSKDIFSFTLILNRMRIYGRDSIGGRWHRHPEDAPGTHDVSAEGRQSVTIGRFLGEAQDILQRNGVL